MSNPWLDQIYQTLPRLLSLYDMDPISPTRGQGDRYRWAWKLIDFGNGTFQGAAHGLARLTRAGMLPPWLSEDEVLEYIDLIFFGTGQLMRSNGSLEEAFPNEGSFCVTALVAFDLLSAVELLDSVLTVDKKNKYLETIRPLIVFLKKNDETHAFISNHLATASAALFKWSIIAGEKSRKAQTLLDAILDEQSAEGWYREYEGADPGYMSLCVYYLADISRMTGQERLKESLSRGLDFLAYAAHPDGSFGGEYGSRNTRFYYPAGIAWLASCSSSALGLHIHMAQSVSEMRCVGLTSIDEPNLIPMFNAFAWAAVLEKDLQTNTHSLPVASDSGKLFQKYFPEAGILFVNRPEYYLAVNVHKGGTCVVCDRNKGKHDIPGALIQDRKGNFYTTQLPDAASDVVLTDTSLEVVSTFQRVHHDLPSPFQFIVLRSLCLTVMHNPLLLKLIKKILVRMLITGKKSLPVQNRRTIVFNRLVEHSDEILSKVGTMEKYEVIKTEVVYRAYHMASSGYWQRVSRL